MGIDWSDLADAASAQRKLHEQMLDRTNAERRREYELKLLKDAFDEWLNRWKDFVRQRNGERIQNNDATPYDAKSELAANLARIVEVVRQLGLTKNVQKAANAFDAQDYHSCPDDARAVKFMLRMILAIQTGEQSISVIDGLLQANPTYFCGAQFATYVILNADNLPIRCEACGAQVELNLLSVSRCSGCHFKHHLARPTAKSLQSAEASTSTSNSQSASPVRTSPNQNTSKQRIEKIIAAFKQLNHARGKNRKLVQNKLSRWKIQWSSEYQAAHSKLVQSEEKNS